jgi:hypothetical protein
MKILQSAGYAFGILVAGGALAGCGGAGSTPSAAGQPAPVMGAATTGTRADHRGSWMAADAKTTDLLYISDLNTNEVYVYSYPGATLKGTLTGFSVPHSECVDKSGNVFISNGGVSEVLEYSHGGTTPIHTFNVPNTFPEGCAVNPVTGDLAVSGDPLGSGPGTVTIFRHAKGTPKTYSTPNVFRVYFIGYDAKGNLFVDGTDMHVAFEFAELPASGKPAKAITLGQSFSLPGAIVWDGAHLAVGDQVSINGPSRINEFTIKGSTGTFVGTTPMSDSCDVLQFTIFGKRVIAANDCTPNVMYFPYPQGGQSTKTIGGGGMSQPVGVAVSVKPT